MDDGVITSFTVTAFARVAQQGCRQGKKRFPMCRVSCPRDKHGFNMPNTGAQAFHGRARVGGVQGCRGINVCCQDGSWHVLAVWW